MKLLAFVLGCMVWILAVSSTAAYVGGWGGHEQGFALGICAFGVWVMAASACRAVGREVK